MLVKCVYFHELITDLSLTKFTSYFNQAPPQGEERWGKGICPKCPILDPSLK